MSTIWKFDWLKPIGHWAIMCVLIFVWNDGQCNEMSPVARSARPQHARDKVFLRHIWYDFHLFINQFIFTRNDNCIIVARGQLWIGTMINWFNVNKWMPNDNSCQKYWPRFALKWFTPKISPSASFHIETFKLFGSSCVWRRFLTSTLTLFFRFRRESKEKEEKVGKVSAEVAFAAEQANEFAKRVGHERSAGGANGLKWICRCLDRRRIRPTGECSRTSEALGPELLTSSRPPIFRWINF